jgi:hypothetical protein
VLLLISGWPYQNLPSDEGEEKADQKKEKERERNILVQSF